jgi:hypothetical protein
MRRRKALPRYFAQSVMVYVDRRATWSVWSASGIYCRAFTLAAARRIARLLNAERGR